MLLFKFIITCTNLAFVVGTYLEISEHEYHHCHLAHSTDAVCSQHYLLSHKHGDQCVQTPHMHRHTDTHTHTKHKPISRTAA